MIIFVSIGFLGTLSLLSPLAPALRYRSGRALQRSAFMVTGGFSPSEWQSASSATYKPLPYLRGEAAPFQLNS